MACWLGLVCLLLRVWRFVFFLSNGGLGWFRLYGLALFCSVYGLTFRLFVVRCLVVFCCNVQEVS